MQYASAELSLTQLTHQRYTTISGIGSLTSFRTKNKIEFDLGPLQNKIQHRQRTPLSITCDSWSNPKSNYKGLTSNIRRSKIFTGISEATKKSDSANIGNYVWN